MVRLLILLALLPLLVIGWRWFLRRYREQGRSFLVVFLLVSIAVALLLLAATGRVHWVGAALASLLAGLRLALPVLLKSLPWLLKWRESRGEPPAAVATAEPMDEARALATLGLTPPYDREAVLAAHKRIMQGIHPDRGGSDFLAAQVNQARDYLLERLAKG